MDPTLLKKGVKSVRNSNEIMIAADRMGIMAQLNFFLPVKFI